MNTLVLIIVALASSGFFSGMEIAFISANKLRFELDKKSNSITYLLLDVLFKNPQQFISTLLVGNNIALVVYGLQMAKLLESPLNVLYPNPVFVTVAQTILSTLVVLFTAEFIPKTLSRLNPNLWLKVFSLPLFLSYVLLYPISKIATAISMIILKIGGVKIDKTLAENSFNRNDLDFLVQESIDNIPKNKEIDHEVKIFQNALDFSEVRLRECMVPRTEIIAIEENTSLAELKNKFIETGLSKILVYKDNIDNIIGYIHTAEMFKNAENWKDSISPVAIVPETMPASKLLKQFMQQKRHIAVIVDEFGGIAGIVTLEDVIEEIFGEIEDEHDSIKLISRKLNENEFLLSGRLEIDAVNEIFNLNLPESDSYVTVAGFILEQYQNFPKLNENIVIDNFEFKILRVSNNKIELVKLKLIK